MQDFTSLDTGQLRELLAARERDDAAAARVAEQERVGATWAGPAPDWLRRLGADADGAGAYGVLSPAEIGLLRAVLPGGERPRMPRRAMLLYCADAARVAAPGTADVTPWPDRWIRKLATSHDARAMHMVMTLLSDPPALTEIKRGPDAGGSKPADKRGAFIVSLTQQVVAWLESNGDPRDRQSGEYSCPLSIKQRRYLRAWHAAGEIVGVADTWTAVEDLLADGYDPVAGISPVEESARIVAAEPGAVRDVEDCPGDAPEPEEWAGLFGLAGMVQAEA